MISVCVGIVLLSLVVNTTTGMRVLSWGSRRFVIALFSKFVDFEHLRNQQCFIKNQLKFPSSDENSAICDVCEQIDGVVEIDLNGGTVNETMKDFIDGLIQSDVPFVARNGQIVEDKTTKFFLDSYLTSEQLSSFHPCQFMSNWKPRVVDHWELMTKVADNPEMTSYYVIWENCAVKAARAFRQLFERPKFLGANVQLTESNFAIMCSGFGGKSYREIELTSRLATIVAEIGSLPVRLEAFPVCSGACASLEFVLTAGDVLVFSADVYRLLVRPSCIDNEILAVGANGNID